MKKQLKLFSGFIAPVALVMLLCSAKPADASVVSTKYYTDFPTFEAEQEAAAELNITLAQESFTLLKNIQTGSGKMTLPLERTANKVSVFGVTSDAIMAGGGGSGSSSTDPSATLKKTLENSGFEVNPKLVDLYARDNSSTELPVSALTSAVGSYKFYNDAAIIVLSRTGSEFNDNAAYNVAGHSDPTDHYLELQDNERALIQHVEENFDRVIVLVNSASPMELGDLEDDDKIGAIMWIGFTGYNGILGLGDVLRGDVNPSGRTVDIYPRDFKKDPTWTNFSDNSQVNPTKNGEKYTFTAKDAVLNADGSAHTAEGWNNDYFYLSYTEGIYMGYRYYETADYEAKAGNYAGFNYDEAVVYPFGYGLSYTSFDWELVDDAPVSITADTVDTVHTIKVKVTNTGKVAGKDVVELYYNPPYTKGGIEKATVNMVDFAKTDLLNPGESQVVTLNVTGRDMASFDYNDANKNDFQGYELETGDYSLSLRRNSHEEVLATTYTVGSDIQITTSDQTGKEIKAWFSQNDEYDTTGSFAGKKIPFTSRANFASTFPKVASDDQRSFNTAALEVLDGQYRDYAYEDDPSDPWYVASVPDNWTQLSDEEAASKTTAASRGIDLSTMIGADLDDAKWDDILNKMSYAEMVKLMQGHSRTKPGLESIGMLTGAEDDGPAQLKHGSQRGMAWVCEVNIAATYNKELAYEQGVMVGNESLFMGVTGWYGPAANIHRSPLAGRNFEYYSQDGVQGGLIAAEVVRGAISKGMHVYIKHFALNDQEKHRGDTGGVLTFANEQAMRDIYLKGFQMAVEDGGCNGTMAAFNRIGLQPTTNYRLYVNVMEDEWGFEGVSDNDIGGNVHTGYDYARCHAYPMGNNNRDGSEFEGTWDASKRNGKGMVMVKKSADSDELMESPTQWSAIRETIKRLLYVYCNTNQIQNGVDLTGLVDKTITGKVNSAIRNQTLASDNIDSTDIRYEIVSGQLPAGVRIAANGDISGTPTESGTFNVQVNTIIDGWISKSNALTFNIESAFALDKKDAKVGEAYSGAITTDVFTEDGGYSGAKYTLEEGALPAGLTLNEDGTITGTPTEAGTFNFRVKFETTVQSGWWPRTYTYYENFSIDVAEGEVVPEPTDPTQEAIDDLKTSVDDLTGKIEDIEASLDNKEEPTTPAETSNDNTIAIVATVLGAVGIVVGAAAIVLLLLKKRA